MARCPPANQHTAKTKTTPGNDHRASKWVIVIGAIATVKRRLRSITLTSNSRQDEKDAADKSKK
jgi:hypothetical protein